VSDRQGIIRSEANRVFALYLRLLNPPTVTRINVFTGLIAGNRAYGEADSGLYEVVFTLER
jgi:hypothetical protein